MQISKEVLAQPLTYLPFWHVPTSVTSLPFPCNPLDCLAMLPLILHALLSWIGASSAARPPKTPKTPTKAPGAPAQGADTGASKDRSCRTAKQPQ